MTVDNERVIDIVSVTPQGEIHLTIADHLEWDEKHEHALILQKKLNAYLAYIESGEILERYPDAKQRPILIDVALLYEPDAFGREFLHRAQEVIAAAGFRFKVRVRPTPPVR